MTRSPSPTPLAALLCLAAAAASGGEIARFDFNADGDPEGWSVHESSREVVGGLLTGVAETDDPKLRHPSVVKDADAAWGTLVVRVREVDDRDLPVPYAPDGVVLLFNTQPGAPAVNFGPPLEASDGDLGGFHTLTWDLSSFEEDGTGRIRLDVIGGPGTVRPGGRNNRFEVASISLSTADPETAPAPAPGVPAEPE